MHLNIFQWYAIALPDWMCQLPGFVLHIQDASSEVLFKDQGFQPESSVDLNSLFQNWTHFKIQGGQSDNKGGLMACE